ncbi:hypothetical protein CEXT_538191 [Caerostris extrusa]|uniref:Uncharacterized protein n=1 Tax=Caerostris extrusa TaxID=172846 RepID=A0AAV4RGY3_CAEEX|nr:hypothetical protein CEXT_538191 [Caerostris extrusa]
MRPNHSLNSTSELQPNKTRDSNLHLEADREERTLKNRAPISASLVQTLRKVPAVNSWTSFSSDVEHVAVLNKYNVSLIGQIVKLPEK